MKSAYLDILGALMNVVDKTCKDGDSVRLSYIDQFRTSEDYNLMEDGCSLAFEEAVELLREIGMVEDQGNERFKLDWDKLEKMRMEEKL
jgi:hypothetical protein